jgi:hypothetical protein
MGAWGSIKRAAKSVGRSVSSAGKSIVHGAEGIGKVVVRGVEGIGKSILGSLGGLGDILKKWKGSLNTFADKTFGEPFEKFASNFDSGNFDGSNQARREQARAQRQAEQEQQAALAVQANEDKQFMANIEKERRRRGRMQGRQSTILAGSLGESGSYTSKKTLLGA